MIPLIDCKPRRLYRLRSRNLVLGVFKPDCGTDDFPAGFIGIREKFDSRYLFTEYHHDQGAPYGTARPEEDLGIDLPPEIDLIESYPGTFDRATGREVGFDRPVADGGRGWFFVDTNEPDQTIRGCVRSNKPLFDWLLGQEKSQDAILTGG